MLESRRKEIMIFRPIKKEGSKIVQLPKVDTRLLPGDSIEVSQKGDVVMKRQNTLLELNDNPGTTNYFLIIHHQKGHAITHEYAWWIARALAGIAGLYVEDCYTLSDQGYHMFPVTNIKPTEIPLSADESA